jgi:iron(III) transport system ATP-binding protein
VRAPDGAAPGAVTLVVRPGDVRLGEGPFRGRLDRVFYRGGVWEALAKVDGLPEPLPISSPRRLASGEVLDLALTGGWVLPEAPSEAPGHDAGRQAAPQPVE